jgi:hypothetical protein
MSRRIWLRLELSAVTWRRPSMYSIFARWAPGDTGAGPAVPMGRAEVAGAVPVGEMEGRFAWARKEGLVGAGDWISGFMAGSFV